MQAYSNKRLYVMKQIDLNFMDEKEKQEALKEAKLLEILRHPNIIEFKEVFKTKSGKLCIVMELGENGDLQKHVEMRRKVLKEKSGEDPYYKEDEILDIVAQVVRAVSHIHELQVLHRDIKLSNLFLKKDGRVKLGDFGIAKVLTHKSQKAKSIVGSPYYFAPEII